MPAKSTPRPHAKRRMRGFERADSLLSTRIRRAGEGRGFAVTRLLTHWDEIVGVDLARAARPVRINYGRGGMGATLTLLTKGAVAPMVEMQKERIKERVNACYGYAAVSRIALTQTAPTGFAEGQAPFEGPSSSNSAPKPVSPEDTQQARQTVAEVSDETLRNALESLGANIFSKQKH